MERGAPTKHAPKSASPNQPLIKMPGATELCVKSIRMSSGMKHYFGS